ncbi:MAG: ABC transporter permease [Proteobacteria bacterium]|nr:ABC transporter permease [Pseudomonadota bacterium]MBI3496966.1 ABC transporter permease [Pseudomonadota bacterium]
MLSYVGQRLVLLIPTAAGMVVVTFCLLLLIPGDPAAMLLGPEASPEAIQRLRTALGLDASWYMRLGDYVLRLAQGDMGMSLFQNEPVSTVIFSRLGATVELAVVALLLASIAGIALGVAAASRQGTMIDVGAMLLAQLGVSMPIYWLGILLALFFSVHLGWLPAIGRGAPLPDALLAAVTGEPEVFVNFLSHLFLPALALGANAAAVISRLVRASMLEVLSEDFVRTAHSKGLRPHRVIFAHVLRNALLPVISMIGLRFGALLGGAVLTESIFGWPGLGQLTIAAISQRDLPLIQGITLTFAILFALVNLAVDLIYAAVDPRIRLGGVP